MKTRYNEYFDKIFWINSRNRPDRFKNMRKRLAEQEIKADRFHAILGGDVDKSKIKFDFHPQIKIFDNGELGCYLSHLAIFKYIIDNKIPRTLILEDDALFVGEFNPDSLPEEWELLYLGQHNYDKEESKENPGSSRAIKEVYKENVYHAERCWLTHAYAITYECALKIYEYCTTIRWCIDGTLADLQTDMQLKTFSFHPNIIVQDGTKSSLRLNNR